MKPLVTVYITNYNYEKYLKQAITSVLNQSFQEFELLIIDDGSTDNSRDIIEEYRYLPKITIIYQQNQGLNYCNNIAMRMAKGRYIMRLDADDYLDPHALEIMSIIMEGDEEIGLVFPDYYYINSDGVIMGEERRHNFEDDVTLFDQPAHGACTMIRLNYLKEIGGYNDNYACQDGYDLWIKFINKFKVMNINKSLFFYRQHDNNLTKNEDLILKTRKKLNELYVRTNVNGGQYTIVIIPVRKIMVGGIIWPLYKKTNGKTIVQDIIEQSAASKKVDLVIATSEDDKILHYLHFLAKINKKLYVVSRPSEYAKSNVSLNPTIINVLEHCAINMKKPDNIMQLSIEYPFINIELIDDAINALSIFKADSLLSVRSEDRTYYQHSGHGLKPILDHDRFTRHERESLYKGAGGVILSTFNNFIEYEKLISGKVGHIIVDSKTAFGVFSDFDFQLFKLMDKHLDFEGTL